MTSAGVDKAKKESLHMVDGKVNQHGYGIKQYGVTSENRATTPGYAAKGNEIFVLKKLLHSYAYCRTIYVAKKQDNQNVHPLLNVFLKKGYIYTMESSLKRDEIRAIMMAVGTIRSDIGIPGFESLLL